jgi:hypothetical protein
MKKQIKTKTEVINYINFSEEELNTLGLNENDKNIKNKLYFLYNFNIMVL